MTLQQFKRRAYDAYSGRSFSPEKRAEQFISDYENALSDDLKEIEAASDEQKQQYQDRFVKYLGAYLSAMSRVYSPMITGPANFPTQRMEKYRKWEDSAYSKFMEFREKAKKGILRSLQPEKTFSSEAQRYRDELESLKKNHEKMKEGNKRIKEAKKTGEDISQYLIDEFGIKPHMIDWTMRWGFGLQNNLANIKRVEWRSQLMEKKEEKAETIGTKEIQFDGFVVIYNYEADRIQVKHDQKPPQDVILKLKQNGFRWSPSFGAWQRQLNQNGETAIQRALGINL